MESSTPIINKGKWENIVVPLPPIKEQNEIIKRIEKHFEKINKLENQMVNRKEKSELLMQSVLREAFTQ
jgi:type I restriction enzyme S subunit